MQRTKSVRRAISGLMVVLLTAAGCGSDSSESVASAATETPVASPTTEPAEDPTTEPDAPTVDPTPEPEPTPTPEPTVDPVPEVDPDEWLVAVNEALATHRSEVDRGFDALIESLQRDFDDPQVVATLLRDRSVASGVLAEAIPPAPTALEDAAETFRQAARNDQETLFNRIDIWLNDPEVIAAAEEGGGRLIEVNVEYPDGQGDPQQLLEILQAACFDLQSAVDDAGVGLIDCTGSSEEPSDLEPGDGGGVTNVGTGEHTLAAGGPYLFDGFSRPIELTFAENMRATVTENTIQLAPEFDQGELTFWILATDEIADPATMVAGEVQADISATVPVPDDLGTWASQLPIPVVSSGVSTFNGVDVPWWRLEGPPPLDGEDGPRDPAAFGMWGFADLEDSFQIYWIRAGNIFWQIPHPEGSLIVSGWPPYEIPDSPSADEKFDYIESVLATLLTAN